VNCEKFIGLDVHRATTTAAVRDASGKLLMESILETKSEVLLQFFAGVRGSLHVTLEEGTWAAWLHDLQLPHVARVIVCNSRKNALLQDGNKNDRIDARQAGRAVARQLSLAGLSRRIRRASSARAVAELSWPGEGRDAGDDTAERRSILAAASPAPVATSSTRGIAPHGWTRSSNRRRAEHLYEELDMLQPLR
jgi:hypothetical protein